MSDMEMDVWGESVICRAIRAFGSEHQQLIAIEEMSELQKELCKQYRGIGSRAHIAEEIADVYIMLEQLKAIFECDDAVESWMRLKLSRLNERIKDVEARQSEFGEEEE